MKVCTLATLVTVALCSPSSATEYHQYKSLLNKLTLHSPRPSVANIASGFGAGQGTVYASLSYSDRDLQTDKEGDDDGSIMFGVGFGDPLNGIGAELSVALTSVSTGLWGDGKFADEGNISAKFHKIIVPTLGDSASVSVGASNIAGWGSTKLNPTNYYVAFSESKLLGNYREYGVAYTIGYGSGVSNLETSGDIFAGIGIGYHDYSGSISKIGNEMHVSVSYYPPKLSGLNVSVTKADLANKLNSERLILTLGYSTKLGGL